MAYYSDEEIDALRAHADIVDVVGHYLQLQKSGKVYKAVCPFHNDHDPSMTVNPDLQYLQVLCLRSRRQCLPVCEGV